MTMQISLAYAGVWNCLPRGMSLLLLGLICSFYTGSAISNSPSSTLTDGASAAKRTGHVSMAVFSGGSPALLRKESGSKDAKGRVSLSRISAEDIEVQDPALVSKIVSYQQELLEGIVSTISSGKPFADFVFGLDTDSLPQTPASDALLEDLTKDQLLAARSLSSFASLLTNVTAKLSSGKLLADALFRADTNKIMELQFEGFNDQFQMPPGLRQRISVEELKQLGKQRVAVLMSHQSELLSAAVSTLSSGKPFADFIFGMDTGELPVGVLSNAELQSTVKDKGSAKFALNATLAMLGKAVSECKSGKTLADAVLKGDSSHLSLPIR
eukprot:gb/GFBE01005405.1/.p1 GENE.gb/GFBE01005405.1/~~gb/GFBE01005405.1/.p1  ORF type:complete len:327 (+),score=79.75 gb/GFBE01005405.1/:1-981(+)